MGVMKHIKKVKKSVGNLRFGGMHPAMMTESLPSIYYISSSMKLNDTNTIYLCCHNDKKGERLIWIDSDHVVINGKKHRLRLDPSYRNHWTTFSI